MLTNSGFIQVSAGTFDIEHANPATNTGLIDIYSNAELKGKLTQGVLVDRSYSAKTIYVSGENYWTEGLQNYIGQVNKISLTCGTDYLIIDPNTDAADGSNLTIPAGQTLTIHNEGGEDLSERPLRLTGDGKI
jgi:hypothetical protein